MTTQFEKGLNLELAKEAYKICEQIYTDYYKTLYPYATDKMIDFAVMVKLKETDPTWLLKMATLAVREGVAR